MVVKEVKMVVKEVVVVVVVVEVEVMEMEEEEVVVAEVVELDVDVEVEVGPDVLIGTLAPHDRVALIPFCYIPDRLYCNMILSALGSLPSRFCFWELTINFLVGHPSWDCSSPNSLNFGVLMESEASELPKGLVLDEVVARKSFERDGGDGVIPVAFELKSP
ncbi:unnamed protein product [Prunus brigantina]